MYKESVVVNNKEQKEYDLIFKNDLLFSSDSKNLAYVAKNGEKEFVVLNGKEGRKYDDIRYLRFFQDNKSIVHFARKGNEIWQVVEKINDFRK